MAALPPEILKIIINHVILPPQLPQKAEDSQLTRAAERGLIGLLSTQLEDLRRQADHRPSNVLAAWASIEVMLGHCALLISTHALAADVLVRAFQSLHTAVNPSIIPIYLRAQNAVLILRKSEEFFIFECFEASPQTVAVMATKGALTRHFPAHAVSIPLKVFHDQNFQYELADKLSKLDIEEIQEMMPQSYKAGNRMGEIRDTTHPGLVTEMLMAILASLGKPVVCHQILKRTRDDVLWHDCLLPWRRSALWLALRVALQTTLVEALGTKEGTSEYKNFMVFFITEIASRASTTNLPNDLCHAIVAKVARRTSKLGPNILSFVQDRALNVCQMINSKQKRTWKAICDQDGKRSYAVDRWKFESDTSLTLFTSRPHLSLFLGSDQGMIQAPSSFSPKCHLWLGLHSGLPSLDGLGTVQDENVYTLAEFEAWVSNCLPIWRQDRLVALDSEDCMALVRLCTNYRDAALVAYHGAPEQISTMILVIAELWYTVDVMALTLLPLLKRFSPDIPSGFFHPLLLPKKTQMQRLRELELYIATRRTQAGPNNPSMFSDPVEKSFAVQFYASSTHHQALRVRIEQDAYGKRAQKEAEWRASKDQFERLKEDAKRLTCLCDDDDAPVCQKCASDRQAEAMTIDVYEWPLPVPEHACISAVVELDCPTELAAWRNMTWLLIHDLGRQSTVRGDNPAAQLPTYAGLNLYARQRQSRLLLASKVKPFAKSHYRVKKFPVTLDSCYARNALDYKLFDPIEDCWTSDQVEDPNIHAICITLLPIGPYSNLQYAVDSVSHSQNEVIADQETCSRALSLQEFLSFGSLRADGERVQWQNIKRELAASNLSLNTEAVCTLITQAAWQAGSSGSCDLRNAHLDLQEPSFASEFLTTIGTILDSIAANWKNDNAMLLSITVVLRLLSLSLDTHVDSVAINLLQRMRIVIGQWTDILSSILHKAVEPNQILKLQQRLLKAAILCKMTFDVDNQYVQRVMSTADDLKIWAKSSMHMRDNLPGKEAMLPNDLRRLVLRDKKISRALYRVVRTLVVDYKCNGLELAIAQQLSGFNPPLSSWTTSDSPNDRWLCTRTASSSDRRSQELHYNMLEGELLVDGKPLGRLPTNYIQDTLYLRLFGAQILHVFPSDMDGMIYMSAQKVNGCLLHFGKRGEKLVIRVRQASQVLELVPQQTFVHDLPSALVEDYFHWLDIARLEVEFRPFNQRWEPKSDNWRLHYRPGYTSTLVRRDRKLIDIRSSTCANIMCVFGTLETVENTYMTLSNSQCLEVSLPRYDLHFFLNHDGQFECRELCRIVDPDQSVGTLIGLKSRLVLSGIQKLAKKHDRILLVPDGVLVTSRIEHHVEVSISVQGPHIRLFQYQIDATLHRLQGGSDTYETLYKAYLHANTSHMLPDPFTERTGTEEALVYLRQRSLGFRKPPDEKTVNLLTRISLLTPRREYYPEHLKVMQHVKWDPILSMMVQHDSYLPLAEWIMTSGNSYSVFYPESQPIESLYRRQDRHLLERGMIRNSCFQSSDFGGDIDGRSHDSKYETRECSAEATRGQKSFEIASLVRDWPKKLEVSEDLRRDLCNLGRISGFQAQYDPSNSLSELLEVEFASSWAPLQRLCRKMSPTLDKYRLLFLFSVIAYGREIASLTTLRTLLAFAFIPELQKVPVPGDHSYIDLTKGRCLDESLLRRIIMDNMSKYNGTGRRKRPAYWNSENRKHEAMSEEQAETVLQSYKAQWPTAHPAIPSELLSSHLNWSEVRRQIPALFYVWTANEKYRMYLNQIQPVLDVAYEKLHQPSYDPKDWHLSAKRQVTYSPPVIPSLAELMSKVKPALFPKPNVLKIERNATSTQKNEKLQELIAAIRSDSKGTDRSIRTQYREDLLASYNAFRGYKEQITPQDLPCPLLDTLLHHLDCGSDVLKIVQRIYECLGGKSSSETLLELGGLWPRITLRTLLSQLSSRPLISLSQLWKDCLLTLGESVTTLQRARRVILAGERNDISTFCAEIENEGHQGWLTNQQPDWLLIEIEGDFLIRPSQARVAFEMIQPSSSQNSLVQLNMGEGKSSVIVPLVAVAVANGDCLSRIIVLKPLSKQMSNTISQRLGGMVDRQIYFMPFSRKIQVDERVILQIRQLNESCLESGGVLLAQPEHILSFKLMGIERLTSGDFAMASPLLQLQRWLDLNTRDILDESDELLDVKFQLIYTLGSQRMMDGQPDRWLVTQGIFDLVEKHASNLQNECPSHIEVGYRTGSSFPTIRLLSGEVSQELINMIAHDVLESQLSGLNFGKFTPSFKKAVLNFIQNRQIKDEDCEEFYEIFGQRESFAQKLLLVRGLLAYSILLFVLRSKRWSVNYGLHPARCLSAVPYRAKGVPAPSAEFGHPDVAIALTCMSYYYTGLSNSQIRKAFELLQKSDDPSLEYLLWIKRCSELPSQLRSWHAVNLEDDQQCYDKLFPALRHSKKIADFFMSNVVFPKEGKEFDEKLTTSGWDIVTKKGPHLVTGFSGTNDNRFLLPLSIDQRDLPELQHTSGKVLDDVLRKENLLYHCARDSLGRQLSAEGLITFLDHLDPSIRILIDVGAQILEISNRDLVKAWMEIASDVDAGIFFDEDDNIMVVTKDSKLEKLSVSFFQSRMDRCVVYLDEVHTRGTDLKLPVLARAAVTLGPRLTKDRLVQACMRLRKLAHGQTLMFLAPPEVHQNILDLTGKPEGQLDGYDVVEWALEQSCQNIERCQPLRVLQGLNYHQREVTMDRFSKTYKDIDDLSKEADHSSQLVTAFREKEEQRLNDLYAPAPLKTNVVPGIIESSQDIQDPVVKTLLKMWRDLDSAESEGASMHEEHEREVAHEVEQETQVERPPKVKALSRAVDPELATFVTTGRLEQLSRFSTAYDRVMKQTSVISRGNSDLWTCLRVTRDFARTVQRPQLGYYDSYLRPVNWVLTSKKQKKPTSLLIISQYEANELLRDIQDPSSGVNLHIYEPRVTKSMGSVDSGMDPNSRSIRQWCDLSSGLRRGLHLFSGQVYSNTYEDYLKLREDLALDLSPSADQTLSFIQAWIAIRRKGQDFLQTHIGQMVSGRSIKEEAFE